MYTILLSKQRYKILQSVKTAKGHKAVDKSWTCTSKSKMRKKCEMHCLAVLGTHHSHTICNNCHDAAAAK